MDEKMLQGQLTRSSLGRLGLIGELYDVRTESFSSRSIFNSSFPPDLIKWQHMEQMELDYKLTENLSDRFEILNVEGELQLSVISGLITVTGSGKFLTDEKKSENSVCCSLIYKLLNVGEKLFASFGEILTFIDHTSLLDPQYTHVIVEVNWGANCILNLEASCNSCNEKKKIEGALGADISKLKNVLSCRGSGEVRSEEFKMLSNSNVKIQIRADVVPDSGWPWTVEGFCQFVLEIPKLVKNVNNGKGKPLNYVMIPLNTIRKLAGLETSIDIVVRKIDESFIMSTIYFFEQISVIKQKFSDVLEKMTANKKYVVRDVLDKTRKKLENLSVKESELKCLISENWVAVKSGNINLKDFIKKVERFKNVDLNLFSYEDFLNSCDSTLDKISSVMKYLSRGVIYLGQGDKLDTVMTSNLSFEFIVLVISSEMEKSDPELYRNTCHYFLSLATEPQPDTMYVVVDFDFNPGERFFNLEMTRATCYHLKGAKIISADLYGKYVEDSEKNFAQLGGGLLAEYDRHKPGNRVELEIRCPGFEKGSCPPNSVKWYCFRCKNHLEYGFNEYLYCSCGRGSVTGFEYRCANTKHGSFFIPFEPETLAKALSTLRPLKELNLLVLGQSGVGKSTWINSIINYLTYESFESARENGLICAIPMRFVIHDQKTYKQYVIHVFGDDDVEEVTDIGQSVTQYSHTYSFLWEDRCVRIIDTPGLGDTRGIIQDKENLKNIIAHLGHIKELHGVCILFKANDNRIISYFDYCLKELLVNLHKSVVKNIIFCFTNARTSGYTPGQTSAILEKVIENIGLEKELGLGRSNMFCLDNEALSFLCSLQEPEIHHDEAIVKSYAHSWEISLNETKRLFDTVKTFEPHQLKETISLVTARSRVLTLTKPLAEISRTIQMNVSALERKKKEISASELTIEELLKNLNLTEIYLQPEPLEHPRTVCASPSCIEYIYYRSADVSEIDYKTHCHLRCYLKEVTPKTVNNALLRGCDAMTNGKCTVCGCGWENHMHLTYSQKRAERTVINKAVQENVLREQSEKEKIEGLVNNLKTNLEKYKQEQEFIVQASVKFGMFLRQNAISLYNDSVEEYLSYIIDSEETKLHRSETEELLIKKLKEMLSHYKAEVKILEEVFQKGEHEMEELTMQDVYDLEQELYKLELTGNDIRENVKVSRSGNAKMMEYGETPIQLVKGGNMKIKNFKNLEKSTPDKETKSHTGIVTKLKNYLLGYKS